MNKFSKATHSIVLPSSRVVSRLEKRPLASAIAIAAVLALGSSASGCISKSKHQEQLDALRSELEGKIQVQTEAAKSLEAALAQAEQSSDDLRKQIENLGKVRQALEDEIGRLQEAKAARESQLAEALASKSALRASLEEVKKALAELNARKAEADKRIAEYKDMLLRFKSLIDAGKLKVKIVDGRMVLVLPMDILFKSGSAKLSEAGQSALLEVGTLLAKMPSKRYQVEGHTDNVPIHNASYSSNWDLASARALSVTQTLLTAGLPPESLSAASFGEFKPTGSNDTPDGQARNRRIEIVVVPDLSGLPGFEELKKLAQ